MDAQEIKTAVAHQAAARAAAEAPFVNLADPARALGPDGRPAVSRRAPICEDVPDAQWNDWRWQLSHRVNDLDGDRADPGPDRRGARGPVARRTSSGSTSRRTSSASSTRTIPNDPIRRQVIPLGREQQAFTAMMEDSLAEDRHSPVPGLVHRYPDRVLMLVTTQCASYCRYCTRSRIVGDPTQNFNSRDHEAQLEYLRRTPQVRDVLISGGDGLTLAPEAVREDPARPARDPAHRDHPHRHRACRSSCRSASTTSCARCSRSTTRSGSTSTSTTPTRSRPRSRRAVDKLTRAGLPVGNQSVLLAGVNDCVHIQRALVHRLVANRIRPYYLYQCDLVEGSGHFRTPVGKGLEIMEGLRGHTSGYAVPTYVIDAPGGGGKIPVMPNYLISLLGPQGRAAQLRGLHHDLRGARDLRAARHGRRARTASTSARSPASRASSACSRASGCGSSRRASRRSTRAATPRRTASRIRRKWVPFGVGAIEGTAGAPLRVLEAGDRPGAGATALRPGRGAAAARGRADRVGPRGAALAVRSPAPAYRRAAVARRCPPDRGRRHGGRLARRRPVGVRGVHPDHPGRARSRTTASVSFDGPAGCEAPVVFAVSGPLRAG